ncbi:MAG: bacterial Ig-like domain-containing protein, partial [Anaeroplasmataceae bacterium]|nr:bacterial Ig-like domain-containing protein [Anaeroplasmataceae bacterium]
NSKGEAINKEFGDNTYHSLFRIDDKEGFSLNLDVPTEIMMIAGGTSGIGIQFVNEANVDLYPISNSETGMRLYYISLPAGNYKLVSSFDTIELYDFYFHNESSPVTEQRFDHIELDTAQGVKLDFNENEQFDHAGLKVYGVNQLGQRQLLSSSEYSVALETPFNETGTYKVIVTYTGSVACINKNADYTVSYTAADLEIIPSSSYSKITATLAKTEFFLENYNVSSLKVFGVLEDDSKEELVSDEYTLRLLYKDQECSGFTEYGEYILEITYQGTKNILNPTTSLKLKNINPVITISFGTSGIGSSDTESYEIDLSLPFNYEDYIKDYDGYTFAGFSSDFKDLTYHNDGQTFKRYYEQNRPNQFTIVYLGPNYERTGRVEYVN